LALDRQSIEKRDFPIGRRGYEPDAVDSHLAQIAEEVDNLKSSSARGGGTSLAGTAAAQVQAIVEAAEQSAASIEREAQEEASRIRQDATRDAESSRSDAIGQSQEHVSKVRESTSGMLARVDAMESELGALIESLRTGANRLNADLALLEGNMGELYSAAGDAGQGPAAGQAAPPPPPPPAPEQSVTPEAAATASGVPQAGDAEVADEADELGYEQAGEAAAQAEDVASPSQEDTPPADAPQAEEEEQPVAAAESTATHSDTDDAEGARLVALNMALNGQSREETDKYLSENFELSDRPALLDEVYATVE
jgi:hypothetical protein